MPIVANNVVVREVLPPRTGSGRTYQEIRDDLAKKAIEKAKAKKTRPVSSYQHDMTTVHKV